MNVFRVMVLAFLATQPLSGVWAKGAHTVILAVGSNTSVDRHLASLNYAEQDVDRFVEAMQVVGQVSPKQIFTAKSPTKAQYEGLLKRSIAAMQILQGRHEADGLEHQDMRFVFYFSGHSDQRGLHLRDGFVTKDEIQSLLKEQSASTRVLFLDGCFASGLAAKGVTQISETPLSLPEDPMGAVAITASAADEAAFESRALRGSIFTHSLVEGLYGKADGDEDGLVTIDELYRHLYRSAKLDGGGMAPKQHPQLFADLSGQGALVMSYPKLSNHPLEIAASLSGELTLALQHGLRFFTYSKERDDALRVFVPEGTYDVRLKRGGDVAEGRVLVLADGVARVTPEQLKWQTTTSSSAKGRHVGGKVHFGVGSDSSYFRNSATATHAEIGYSHLIRSSNSFDFRVLAFGNYSRGRQWADGDRISATTVVGHLGTGVRMTWVRSSVKPFSQVQVAAAQIRQRWKYASKKDDRFFDGRGFAVGGGLGLVMPGSAAAEIDWGIAYRRNHLFVNDASEAEAFSDSNVFQLFLVL